MYQENGGFHQSSSSMQLSEAEDAFSQTHLPNCNNFSIEEQSYPQNDVAAMEMELQHQLEIQEIASNWQELTAFNFAAKASFADAPDLVNIFPPPPSLLPNFPQKSPSFSSGGVVYDPLNQPPLLRELFHSLPHVGGLFTNAMDEKSDGVFEFAAEIGGNKQVSSEKHRRVVLKDKYEALRALVPTPTKNDRASIVGDAIGYIKELKRTVSELKGLVERKRCGRERLKMPKVEENDMDPYNGSLRSSWLHRKSNNTEVDVRIIDDEITVKLVQQKRINCLLFVSKVLDELHLDLHHVAGGVIGDYYSYLFNSKICEGSTVYASAVANKLIEVVDKQYAAVPVPPTTTYLGGFCSTQGLMLKE